MLSDDALNIVLAEAAKALRNGQPAEAADHYAAILAERPDLPDIWFNLGWSQRATRRFADALDSYDHAIAHGVERPEEVHLNRAAILSDHLFRGDEAIAALDTALTINPRFVPAWLSLGNMHEDRGDSGAARRAYAAALDIDPDNGRALARTAMIDLFEGQPDRARVPLETALPRIESAPDYADILYALGSVLEAKREYRAAFDAIEAANAIAQAFAPVRYDPAAQEAAVDGMIAAWPAAPTIHADSESAPVFVVGMFRSGSTLVEQILSRHSALTGVGESEAIPAIAAGIVDYPVGATTLMPDAVKSLRARYRQEIGTPGTVIDKRCDNFMHIGLIKTLFPAARIAHTVRQPLDNLLSVYFLHFGDGVPYGYDLGEAAHYYAQYRRMMAHWQRVFPDDIHDVDYDALVAEPGATLMPLLAHLGLPWEDACLSPEVGQEAVRTASAWQVRRPLHAGSSGRWRHYEDRLLAIRNRLDAAGLL